MGKRGMEGNIKKWNTRRVLPLVAKEMRPPRAVSVSTLSSFFLLLYLTPNRCSCPSLAPSIFLAYVLPGWRSGPLLMRSRLWAAR